MRNIRYYSALLVEDGAGMLDAANELLRVGRRGLAIRAFQNVALFADRPNMAASAQAAAAALVELELESGLAAFDVSRFSDFVALTAREKEVGKLAAEGFSNQVIVDRLVLSVRTVETHMRRIMR